jgi:hypothetical protein
MLTSTDGVARRVLLALGIGDLVCGAVGLLATHELAHVLGTSTAVPIVTACLPLFVLGVAGLLASRCQPAELPIRLRIQSALNGGYAVVLTVIAAATTMHSLGTAVVVLVAVSVVGIALIEWRLGAGGGSPLVPFGRHDQ